MVDIQTVSIAVASASIVVAAVYYVLQLRHQTRMRDMEIGRMVASELNSEQGAQRYSIMMNMEWKDYDDFMEKYSSHSNPEIFSKWISQFMAWDTLGFFIKHKVVKTELLYELGGWIAIRVWEKYKDIIQHMRDESSARTLRGQDFQSNAEFFVQEMLRIKMKRDASFKDTLKPHRETSER
jgi:hypothetical protein